MNVPATAPRIEQDSGSCHRVSVAHLAGETLLLAETAAVYGVSPEDASMVARALEHGDDAARDALSRIGLGSPPLRPPSSVQINPVRALALTVSQTCNLACGYCYASGGSFGAPQKQMAWDVAQNAIDQLLEDTPPGGAVKIAFMGGEPMVARDLIRRAVDHANLRAAARAVKIGYALTTNGTLITENDAAFFARHRFAITVSLDGGQQTNDLLRPAKGGGGSFARVAKHIAPLIALQDELSLSARVTVTPDNLDLPKVVGDIHALGFETVGVSPMITSPTGKGALAGSDFSTLLDAMKECGNAWLINTLKGESHPFTNLATVLSELHRGQARSHGCGAARDYLAVDASGRFSACHRFVNDPLGEMGDLQTGIDHEARAVFLKERTVERQSPCQSCWARRLCGGGCHHEVLHAGRPACDFVRGWLDFGLRAYGRMMDQRPEWFDANA